MSDPLFYLIAGEPSGDLLGGRLMAALKILTGGKARFGGVGGEAMRAGGLTSLFPQADIAVMGLAEVVPRIPMILNRLDRTLADILERQPDAVITIDSWGFTGRVAKRLKALGSTIPRIHYVAPMVWAWKEKRATQVAGRIDRLLCLLPNEPAYFAKLGLDAVHVGHPVLEGGKGDGAAFRRRHKIAEDVPLLCVLPGSRHSEISRLLPVFQETAERLAADHPALQLVIPTVETVAGEVEQDVESWRLPTLVVRGAAERADAFAASRAALAASGTVALELARAGVPMAIAYKLAPLTAILARRLIKIRFACLLNILVDREIVPEFIQQNCRPDLLVPAMAALLDDEELRSKQIAATDQAMTLLGVEGEAPSMRAARAILEYISLAHKGRGRLNLRLVRSSK